MDGGVSAKTEGAGDLGVGEGSGSEEEGGLTPDGSKGAGAGAAAAEGPEGGAVLTKEGDEGIGFGHGLHFLGTPVIGSNSWMWHLS